MCKFDTGCHQRVILEFFRAKLLMLGDLTWTALVFEMFETLTARSTAPGRAARSWWRWCSGSPSLTSGQCVLQNYRGADRSPPQPHLQLSSPIGLWPAMTC